MSSSTVINAFNCYDEMLGSFCFQEMGGHVVSGSLFLHTYSANRRTWTCSYLNSSCYPRIEATDPGMIGWFLRQRSVGDAAPAWLLEAINGGITLPGPAVLQDKCTCGTSRTPSGGVHLDYCDNFAGRGCAGIVDAAKKRCSCCV